MPSVSEPFGISPLEAMRSNVPVIISKQSGVAEVLEMVSLDPEMYLNRFPVDLSGGQTQRAAIARAIVDKPKVLLADEPMSAIDVAARVRILEAFRAIRAANPSMSLVMVSHDLGVVQHIADRIVVLHDGRVEESGTTTEILKHPCSAYTRSLIEAASMQA
jgi:peptide/nickel transport system ATP-binding protein